MSLDVTGSEQHCKNKRVQAGLIKRRDFIGLFTSNISAQDFLGLIHPKKYNAGYKTSHPSLIIVCNS